MGREDAVKYVKGLTCICCAKNYPALPHQYLCRDCGQEGLLEVTYDYPAIRRDWSQEDLKKNPDPSIWRYLPLLPIQPETPRPLLRIGGTPFYESRALAQELGLKTLFIKDDGLNPTGSLKDRASAIAAVKAQEAGAQVIACSSTGNAASSLSGMAASLEARISPVIFVPERSPLGKVSQSFIYGAWVFQVSGSYEEAFQLSQAAIARWGWYNRNAAINPYLLEGKKTISFELAEDLEWEMPHWIVLSVGDGCTLAGAWKGLWDLHSLGLIRTLPRLLGVQAEGAAPIFRAFHRGAPFTPGQENTQADSIAVGNPRNYRKALLALGASQGDMVTVTDEEILTMMKQVGKRTGIFGEMAGVAGFAGVLKMVSQGKILPQERVLVVVTGNGLKDTRNVSQMQQTAWQVPPSLSALEEILPRELLEARG